MRKPKGDNWQEVANEWDEANSREWVCPEVPEFSGLHTAAQAMGPGCT